MSRDTCQFEIGLTVDPSVMEALQGLLCLECFAKRLLLLFRDVRALQPVFALEALYRLLVKEEQVLLRYSREGRVDHPPSLAIEGEAEANHFLSRRFGDDPLFAVGAAYAPVSNRCCTLFALDRHTQYLIGSDNDIGVPIPEVDTAAEVIALLPLTGLIFGRKSRVVVSLVVAIKFCATELLHRFSWADRGLDILRASKHRLDDRCEEEDSPKKPWEQSPYFGATVIIRACHSDTI